MWLMPGSQFYSRAFQRLVRKSETPKGDPRRGFPEATLAGDDIRRRLLAPSSRVRALNSDALRNAGFRQDCTPVTASRSRIRIQ